MLRKIELLEKDVYSDTAHGQQIPALVRENIGISVEVQFLEYEKDMRLSLNSCNSRPQGMFFCIYFSMIFNIFCYSSRTKTISASTSSDS